MAVIGIDLGTTYSAAARCVNGEAEIIPLDGEATMPSVVSVLGNGKIAVGRKAKNNQAKNPQNTVLEAKRKMGTTDKIMLGSQEYLAQDISGMILKTIKELAEEQLGEEVTGAVISIPAYFKDPGRQATYEAGKLAGLDVLRIINEPTAAAYAYGVLGGDGEGEQLFVVYDLGGGTFDVTVIRMAGGELEVIGTGGDPKLGGGDFDDCIVAWILDEIEKDPRYKGYASTLTDERREAVECRLKSYAEEGKIQLCNSTDEVPSYQFHLPKVDFFNGKSVAFDGILTMAEFESMIAPLLDKSLGCIDEALKVPREKHSYTEADITAVLLVGGSTRVPAVRKLLEERFREAGTEIRGQEAGINPDEIVALGAGIVAVEEDPDSAEVGKRVLVDVTGHTLSVAVFDEQRQRQMLCPIIPKETTIPCADVHDFQSQGKGQRQCKVEVYQGEGIEIDREKVTRIAEFIIEIDPIKEPTPLQIGLELDTNGMLLAHATNRLNGQRVECRVNYEDTAQVSPEELERRRRELEKHLKSVIGQAANPLDGAAQPANPWAQPAPEPGAAAPPAGAAAPAGRAAAAPPDPTLGMNPVLRNLYKQALANYTKVPPERQGPLAQLMGDIEAAALAGDQARLQQYTPELAKLLEGVI